MQIGGVLDASYLSLKINYEGNYIISCITACILYMGFHSKDFSNHTLHKSFRGEPPPYPITKFDRSYKEAVKLYKDLRLL